MTIVQRRPDGPVEPHRQSQVTDPVVRFARGEISRKHAMAELGGISYGALIDKVVESGLTLPSLPGAELEQMAGDMVRLLAPA
jgi:hypothetical protein